MVKYIARRKKLIKMNPKNFFTEYSRTGIAKCRQCRKILAKDGLRIASVVKVCKIQVRTLRLKWNVRDG